VEEFEDGMIVHGCGKLKAASIESHGDHRIAMAFSIAGLFADGETVIEGTDCINTSYPGFAHHLEAIRNERRNAADFVLPATAP
jgi:3-phosphoshikimate 1-carboxyvinyltransferase